MRTRVRFPSSNRQLNRLTDSQIKSAKFGVGKPKLYDGGNLVLILRPTGSKLWQFRYRYAGKENTASIGKYPDVSLAIARSIRADYRKLLDEGINPNQHKKRAQISLGNTFKVIANRWWELVNVQWKSDKHRHTVMRSLELDAFPGLGNLPVDQITALDVENVIKKIHSRGTYETANRVLSRVTTVLAYAVHLELIQDNPARGAGKFLPKPEKAKDRNLPALRPSELPTFLKDLAEYKCLTKPQTFIALRLQMATLLRPGECLGGRWEEIDAAKSVWAIPAERMKNNRIHFVPLSTQSQELIKELRQYTGKSDLMFPHRTKPYRSLTSMALLNIIYRMGYKGRHCAHGIRATGSTYLNELSKFDPDAIERQLSHVEGNRIKAAYDRSWHWEERVNLMQVWSDFLDTCEDVAGNVVSIVKSA